MKSILMLGCLAALSGSAAAFESSALLSSFNAATALARQATSGPIVAQSGERPFITLERLYKNTNTPADMLDIDDSAGKQRCVFAFPDSTSTKSVQIRRFTKTFPSNGPLFPERKETKIIGWTQGDPWQVFKYVEMSRTPTDLVVSVPKNSYVGNSPHVTNLRKTGDMVPFQAIVHRGGSKEQTAYGYCYR